MRRLYFIVLMGCTSLVGVGDLTLSPDAMANDASPNDVVAEEASPPLCGLPGPTDGMVAYFPFDEDSGNCAHDCTGNWLACSDSGAPTWVPTSRGGGLSAGANNSCLHIPGFVPENAAFSASAWILTKTVPSGSGTIIGRHSNGRPGWRLAANQLDAAPFIEMRLFIDTTGASTALTASGLALNQSRWQHVVMNYVAGDASTVVLGDAASSGNLPQIAVTNDQVVIGCRSTNDYQFIGVIDELRIYDHALSAQEIMALEN